MFVGRGRGCCFGKGRNLNVLSDGFRNHYLRVYPFYGRRVQCKNVLKTRYLIVDADFASHFNHQNFRNILTEQKSMMRFFSRKKRGSKGVLVLNFDSKCCL